MLAIVCLRCVQSHLILLGRRAKRDFKRPGNLSYSASFPPNIYERELARARNNGS